MKDGMYLLLACRHLSISEEQVMSWRVYADHIALIVWPGPKHKIPLAELVRWDTPDATSAAAVLAEQHDLDLHGIVGSGSGGRILLRDVEKMIGPAPEDAGQEGE